MSMETGFSTAVLQAVFADEVGALGGQVSDVFDDGRRLFARAVFPCMDEIRTGDNLRGGVALAGTARGARIHPYLFRQVCRNGAIMAQAIETRRVDFTDFYSVDEVESSVREAVRACSTREAFESAVGVTRRAALTEVDMMLALTPLLARLGDFAGTSVIQDVLSRFFEDEDRTTFGLMNAVTSVARDSRDPDTRWRLEEFGGGIASGLDPAPPADDLAARAVAVG